MCACARVRVCVRVCVCVCVRGGGGGTVAGRGGGLWVGNNIMKLFSLLYIAAYHTARTLFFLCISRPVASCHMYTCITFFNMLLLIFVPLNVENVGECYKAQCVCVHQRITLYKKYLLLLLDNILL